MRLIVTALLCTLCGLSVQANASPSDSDAPETSASGGFTPEQIAAACEQIADSRPRDDNGDRDQFLQQCAADAQQFLSQHHAGNTLSHNP